MSIQIGRAFITSAACAALLFGASACGDKKPAGQTGDSTATSATLTSGAEAQEQKNAEASRMFVEEVFNKGNMAYIDQYVAPDFVDHTPSPEQEPGTAGLKKMFTEWHAAMPDMKASVINVITQGDLVAMQVSMSGTQTGPMMGMPATGKKMDITGVDILRMKDGKAVEHWGYSEEAKMMMQLGMMPPMDGTPPPAGGAAPTTPPAGGTPAKKDSAGAKADSVKK
jgi:steroid delta-isomerase-like uncharacterized protein